MTSKFPIKIVMQKFAGFTIGIKVDDPIPVLIEKQEIFVSYLAFEIKIKA